MTFGKTGVRPFASTSNIQCGRTLRHASGGLTYERTREANIQLIVCKHPQSHCIFKVAEVLIGFNVTVHFFVLFGSRSFLISPFIRLCSIKTIKQASEAIRLTFPSFRLGSEEKCLGNCT